MHTVTVQYTHENAFSLLKQLEQLKIIKLIYSSDKAKKVISSPVAKSAKYRGQLSAASAEKFRTHIAKARSEWDERFPL